MLEFQPRLPPSLGLPYFSICRDSPRSPDFLVVLTLLCSFNFQEVALSIFMANRRDSIEMSEVEAGPSTRRPSTPKSPAIDLTANIERFEQLKQGFGATLSPATSSKGKEYRRPRSINGHALQWSNIDAQGWSESAPRDGFLPQPPKKTKLHEYNKTWRKNYTLSLGTTIQVSPNFQR